MAWELELCLSTVAEFHVLAACMERKVLEEGNLALVMVHLDWESELVVLQDKKVVMDLMVVARGSFWVAMLVGLGGDHCMVEGVMLDGCGAEEGEGCHRYDDSAMVGAVPGSSAVAVEVVLGGNGEESVAVEVTLAGCGDGLVGVEAAVAERQSHKQEVAEEESSMDSPYCDGIE